MHIYFGLLAMNGIYLPHSENVVAFSMVPFPSLATTSIATRISTSTSTSETACAGISLFHDRYFSNYMPKSVMPSTLSPIKSVESQDEELSGISRSHKPFQQEDKLHVMVENVPSTIPEALNRFFLGPDHGPIIVITAILGFIIHRIILLDTSSFQILDFAIGLCSIILWWFQEHFLHVHFLHSDWEWMGKEIHNDHHEQPYYHISIEPTPLLLGWLMTAHLILRNIFPLPLALSATVGYAVAGMWYVWMHYIVHTKVKPRSKLMKQVKNNHIRHHLLNSDYWLAFSIPLMDDLFGTNPSIKSVRDKMKQG
jgi:hypothetical protein